MDIFSKSKPDLVSKNTLKEINKLFNITDKNPPTWGDNMTSFYNDVIRPNLFALIILLVVVVFLVIRYILKQQRQERKLKKLKKLKRNPAKRNKTDQYNIIYSDTTDQINNLSDNQFNDNDITSHIADELNSIDDDDLEPNSIEQLENDYHKFVRDYGNDMSENMIKEIYDNKANKMQFNELSKMLVG